MTIKLTNHCEERFSERIAKTDRTSLFVARANHYGVSASSVRCGELRRLLCGKEREYGTTAKIYKNCVYWFSGNKAITVYPLAQKYHGRI